MSFASALPQHPPPRVEIDVNHLLESPDLGHCIQEILLFRTDPEAMAKIIKEIVLHETYPDTKKYKVISILRDTTVFDDALKIVIKNSPLVFAIVIRFIDKTDELESLLESIITTYPDEWTSFFVEIFINIAGIQQMSFDDKSDEIQGILAFIPATHKETFYQALLH